MKNKIALILILTLLVALCAVFAACEDPHEHDLQHFEAKDPTCVKEGNSHGGARLERMGRGRRRKLRNGRHSPPLLLDLRQDGRTDIFRGFP